MLLEHGGMACQAGEACVFPSFILFRDPFSSYINLQLVREAQKAETLISDPKPHGELLREPISNLTLVSNPIIE